MKDVVLNSEARPVFVGTPEETVEFLTHHPRAAATTWVSISGTIGNTVTSTKYLEMAEQA